jgi:hypothetical protein
MIKGLGADDNCYRVAGAGIFTECIDLTKAACRNPECCSALFGANPAKVVNS